MWKYYQTSPKKCVTKVTQCPLVRLKPEATVAAPAACERTYWPRPIWGAFAAECTLVLSHATAACHTQQLLGRRPLRSPPGRRRCWLGISVHNAKFHVASLR
jgi:hypothetical protein